MAAPIISLPTPTADTDFVENWDEYWFLGALWASRKSKDPRCRVGALIVHEGVMVASGFNGLARNIFDDPHVLHDAEEKLKWICHAEANAIFNAARQGVSLKGATIYVTKFPCLVCCNAIIQVGIARIYTQDEKYWDDDPADKDHSRKKSLLHQSKIEIDAPFHPDFAPKRVTKKPVVPSTPRPREAPSSPPLAAEKKPAQKVRKRAKPGTPKAENMNLFPARRAIPGGQVEK